MKHCSVRLAVALALFGVGSLGLAPSASAADPSVTVGSGLSTDPGTPVALTGVTVDDGGLASLRVRLEVLGGAGTLTMTELTGLSFDEGDGDHDPAIEVRGTAASLNAGFATLVFTPAPGFEGNAKIDVSVTDGTLAFEDHFYEYVAAPGIAWEDARDAAAARTFYGRQGYLATITSQEENDFAAAKLEGEGWIGARAEISNDRQHWRWVTGPEAEHPDAEGAGIERGLPFYFGADMTVHCDVPVDAGPVNGMYSNWLVDEPNNCEDELVAHFVVPGGTWNDYAPDNGSIEGFVVEYGGLSSDSPVALPTATAVISVQTGEPSTTSTSSPATTTSVPSGGTGAAGDQTGAGHGQAPENELAFTGDATGTLAVVGAALVATGTAIELRRRRSLATT